MLCHYIRDTCPLANIKQEASRKLGSLLIHSVLLLLMGTSQTITLEPTATCATRHLRYSQNVSFSLMSS